MSLPSLRTICTAALPSGDGYLPWFIFLLGSYALFGSVAAYFALLPSDQLYKQCNAADEDAPTGRSPPAHEKSAPTKRSMQILVTPLTGRIFGTWTFLSAIVRFYAAHHLHLQPIYDMTMWTFVLVTVHFYAEFMHYGTMGSGRTIFQLVPFTQAPITLAWMLWARESYIGEH